MLLATSKTKNAMSLGNGRNPPMSRKLLLDSLSLPVFVDPTAFVGGDQVCQGSELSQMADFYFLRKK
ncbi:MAG TPA: hypothetical protein DD827_00270 [Gammaproteobacteria bacterium]|jgi:hypothetical protein|nr:hypothetical protein [Gammaproteobacteria bacterium]